MIDNFFQTKIHILLPFLFAANTALFCFAFVEWISILYILSCIITAAIYFSLFAQIFTKKQVWKYATKSLIFSLVTTALLLGITYLINNIILNAANPQVAVIYVSVINSLVFFALYFAGLTAGKLKKLTAILCTAVSIFISCLPIIKNSSDDSYSRVAAPAITGHYTEKETEKVMNADFYISVDGSDSADGSFEHPFASFDRAKQAVKEIDKTGKSSITVAVKAGEYRINQLVFSKEDSGTKGCPIIYKAYGDGEVTLNGGISLNTEDFKPISDTKMLERLSEEARENAVCIDLSDYSITAEDYGKIYALGSYNTASKYDGDYTGPIYCELFVDDTRMTLSRYPNNDWLYTGKVVETGEGYESDGSLTKNENWDSIRNPKTDVYKISSSLAKRIASWETTDDVWMFGFWKYDWADASTPIGSFDANEKTISPKFVSLYGTKENAPYYFFNVFEELDSPGEWYLDRDTGILYLYPPENFGNSSVDLSLSAETLITADADYITFEGFTLKGTRGDGIIIKGNGNTIKNCLIKNIAGTAITAEGYDNLVSENEITKTGCAGIVITGGDCDTLMPGNSKADNNLIHDWSQINMTYQPAVTLNGCGNTCSHNEIYNSPHEAITYSGNNHIIEYNLIHDVCLLSDDAGAIYSGRRWDWYGDVIRYNCIYNCGSGEHKPVGIYLDDALSGQTVYGNLLINIPGIGIELGGGRDLDIRNNIIINTNSKSFTYDQRAIDGVNGGWFTHSSQKDGDMWQNLFNSAWKSDIWQEAFPQMSSFSSDFSDTANPDFVPNPANSLVTGNLVIEKNGELGDISEKAMLYSDISENAVYKLDKLTDIFTDAESGDYSLKTNALSEILPEFEELPLDEIGRY